MSDMEQSYHYGVIRRAIELIDASNEPLSLEELSAAMGMSAAHFQRLFSKWAGVSPKRFQQYLALGHAKSLLHNHLTTLETAQTVGLSGTGRLHDLFLRWEAMSPGDYARRGAGLTIFWAWCDSPFGAALVMATPRGICGIAFAAETGKDAAMNDMRSRWPLAEFQENPAKITPLAHGAFGPPGTRQHTPVHLMGSALQIKVWEALVSIPEGQVCTYSDIAERIGNPKAVRAVASAIGRNPISWVIPCHRALRKTGGMGGYHWGLPLKRAMLAYEGARSDAALG